MSARAPPDTPAFYGYIETTGDALRVIWAAHRGAVSRLSRRLNEAEKKRMIRSGNVFVFSVEESGIRRWTDGLMWSPSRIVGNFLVYREMSERGQTRGQRRRMVEEDTAYPRESASNTTPQIEQAMFKIDGLTKKTITIKVKNSDLHLIAYYTQADLSNGALARPIMDANIMSLQLPPGNFQLTNLRNPPRITCTEDGKTRIDDEVDTDESPSPIMPQYSQPPPSPSSVSPSTARGVQRGPDRGGAPSSRRLSVPGMTVDRQSESLMSPTRYTPYMGSYGFDTQPNENTNLHEGSTRQRSHTVGVIQRTNVYPPVSSWPTSVSASDWHQRSPPTDFAYNDRSGEPQYQLNAPSHVWRGEERAVNFGQHTPSWNEYNSRSNDFREVGQMTQQTGSSSRQLHHPSLSPSPMPSSPTSSFHYKYNYTQPSLSPYMPPPNDILSPTSVTHSTSSTPYQTFTSYTLATATAPVVHEKIEEEEYSTAF